MGFVRSVINYGILALVAKLVQFTSLLLIENNLDASSFGQISSYISVQMGVSMILMFGMNEGFIGTFLKSKKSFLLTGISYMIRSISLTVIFVLVIIAVLLPRNMVIYPLINGVIFFDLFLNASFFRIQSNHKNSQLHQYLTLTLFYLGLSIAIFLDVKEAAFPLSSLVLVLYFSVLKSGNLVFSARHVRRIYLYLKDELRAIIYESKNYFLISVFGWFTSFGVTLFLNILVSPVEAGQYFFISTISGSVLILTNALFSVWNPLYFANKIDQLSNDNFYKWLMLTLMICSMILILGYSSYRKDIENSALKMALVSVQYVLYVPFWKIRYSKQKNNQGLSLAKIVLGSNVLALIICSLSWYIHGEWVAYSYGAVLSVISVVVAYVESKSHTKEYVHYGLILCCVMAFLSCCPLTQTALLLAVCLLLVPYIYVTLGQIKVFNIITLR